MNAPIMLVLVFTVAAAMAAGAEGEKPSAELDAIPTVKSPVIMKGIYGTRSSATNRSAAVATETAVMRSLRWLKSVQNADGSWGGDADAFDAGTALALLTFMGHGETVASEEFGDAVQRAFKFLLADMKHPGRLERKGQPPAFGHGISSWALCEGFALTRIPIIAESAEAALAVILKGQRESGLWDVQYRTGEGQDDIEASAWQVLAVKSGLMMGSKTDGLRDCISRAADGMEKVLAADTNLATAAAAAYCLQLAGRGRNPASRAAVERLSAYTANWEAPDCRDPVFRWYLTGQVMFHHGGQSWVGWNRSFTPMLVAHQAIQMREGGKDMGYWDSPGQGERYGRIYSTALSTMMLQVFSIRPRYYFPPPAEEGTPAQEEDLEIKIEL